MFQVPGTNKQQTIRTTNMTDAQCAFSRAQVMLSQHIRVHAFDVRVVHCETLKLLGENGSTRAGPIGAREVRKMMSTSPED